MTTPTSGAADLPEALRLSNEDAAMLEQAAHMLEAHAVELDNAGANSASAAADCSAYVVRKMAAALVRHEDQFSALTARAISAEPAGAGYAALPEVSAELYQAHWGMGIGFKPNTVGKTRMNQPKEGEYTKPGPLFTADQMRAFADATHTLRVASHGQAPAQPVNTKTHDLLSTMIGIMMGHQHKIGYTDASPIAKVIAEAVDHLKDWPYPEPIPTPQAADTGAGSTAVGGMVSVCKEDASRYCEILTLLGMEEEGDPAAEVQRLQDRAAHAIWSIWEALPGYLIDNCEGTPVSEEMLQHALSKMLADPQYKAPDWAAAPQPAPPADSVLEDAAPPIAVLVSELRKHRFCGDCYPENGWPGVNDAIARYELWKRAARKQGGSHD